MISEGISESFRGLNDIHEGGTFQVEDGLCGGPEVGGGIKGKERRPEMPRSSQPKAE